MQAVHTPVMLNECLALLVPPQRADDTLVMCDSTLGEGGHTAAFLEHYPNLSVIGIDRDKEQIERAKERLATFGSRVTFCNAWFDDYYDEMKAAGRRADVILFDLGISMFHYVLSGRGFSFQKDEMLDMRLDPSQGVSAADILNTWREDEIANVIYKYGGERFSRRIARAVAEARRTTKITSSAAFADIVYNAVPSKYRYGRIHPATRTFQALRIAVNGELDRLERALHSAFDCLNDGGRMGVISFHSLEDRITKQFFRKMATTERTEPSSLRAESEAISSHVRYARKSEIASQVAQAGRNRNDDEGKGAIAMTEAVLITRKGVKAADSEAAANPPSRSATLRVLQRREVHEG